MQYSGIILSLITIIVMTISLYAVIKSTNEKTMLYVGLFLIGFGVISSAFSNMLIDLIYGLQAPETHRDRVNLLSNLYLVIAAIGANFLSTSIVTRNNKSNKV